MSKQMKDSGIPWIGEIPDDWRIETIGSCIKEVDCKNSDCSEDNALQFKMGTIISKKNGDSKYNPETLEAYNKVQVGDIVINGLNLSFDLISQRVGLVKENGVITSAYLAVRPLSFIDSRFLAYLFKGYDTCKALHSMGKGLRQTLGYKEFRRYYVIFPNLEEQQRIADFLDQKCGEVDEMVSLQEKIIEELKAYKQAIITEAVCKGLNPDAEMKDSGIEWIGEIPKAWEICRLKDIAIRRNQKADDYSLKYIGLEHLVGFSEIMVETENTYNNDGANICFTNDVLFGKLRPYLGKAKVVSETCCCSTEFLVLKEAPVPKYLRYLMLSNWFIEIVNASTYGTKMPRANADFIMGMLVPRIPVSEQQEIAKYLDQKCAEIDSLVAIKQQKIEELKDYKKSIIYEYITGKKEVV